MTGAKLEYHVRASITFKALVDASTYTLWVTTIPFTGSVPTTFYHPILETITGFGARMGTYMPEALSTSLTINNEPGSLGYQRRFSDLFERYSIIGQQIRLQIAYGAIGEVVDGDFADVWYGTVKRVRESSNRLSIEAAGQGIRNRIITKVVTTTDFPNAPQAALGTALPIVFGSSVEVKPVRVAADADTSPEFAYATTLSTTYPVGGVQQYYAKARDGKYAAIASAGTTTTVLFGAAYVAGKNASGMSYDTEYAKAITTGSSGYAITGAGMVFNKTSGSAPDGKVTLEIREADTAQPSAPTAAPGTTIASASYGLAAFVGAAGDYQADVSFPDAVVLKPNTTYYFVYNVQPSASTNVGHYYDGAVSETGYSVTSSTGLWTPNTGVNSWGFKQYYQIYGAVLTDTKSSAANIDGLGHAYVEVTQRTAPTGFTNPDLTKLDLIFAIQGLKDSSTGTITGTNNQLIESPQEATELMFYEWNGSAWASGQFNTSANSGTHAQVNTATSAYYRKLNGRTSGRTRLTDFLSDICRNSASRLTLNSSSTTPFGFWAWGGTETEDATISDEDANVTDYEILGSETVVNDVEIYYSDILRNIDVVTGSAQGEFKNFAAQARIYYGTNSIYTAICGPSYNAFGTRKNATVTYPLVGDSASAVSVSNYLVRVYQFPHQYVDIEVPFWKYKALALMDAVRLVLPQLPAFFGTASNAALPSYAGTSVDINEGQYLKRAAHVRAQVEGFQVFFDSEQVPKLRLGLRLLTNLYDPT